MKRISLIALALSGILGWTACNRADASFKAIDLTTGEEIRVVEDSASGRFVNAETRKSVELFVNKQTKDTIYGVTGEVVNNKISMSENGSYVYYGKVKDGDYKMKREKDGDYKIKYGDDYKEKYDDGDYKIKRGDYKKKVESDGDIKIKDGDRKIKIDGETGEVKVKN